METTPRARSKARRVPSMRRSPARALARQKGIQPQTTSGLIAYSVQSLRPDGCSFCAFAALPSSTATEVLLPACSLRPTLRRVLRAVRQGGLQGAISTSGSGASARATRGAERAHRARRATRRKPKSKRESQKFARPEGALAIGLEAHRGLPGHRSRDPERRTTLRQTQSPGSLRTGRTTRATQLRGSMPHPCAAHCPAHPTSRTLATRRTRARRLRRAPPS